MFLSPVRLESANKCSTPHLPNACIYIPQRGHPFFSRVIFHPLLSLSSAVLISPHLGFLISSFMSLTSSAFSILTMDLIFPFGSLPLVSQAFSHETGFLFGEVPAVCPSSYLSSSVFSPSALFSLPPHSSAVLNFLTFITSHLPPFSIPTTTWFKPFSIWTKISPPQSLQSRHSPALFTSELTAAATQKQWICSP